MVILSTQALAALTALNMFGRRPAIRRIDGEWVLRTHDENNELVNEYPIRVMPDTEPERAAV